MLNKALKIYYRQLHLTSSTQHCLLALYFIYLYSPCNIKLKATGL